ncbi:hypothetical protein [Cobetia sp. L2A1]|uniref:hypothetical protein n=1 Tax=Cobetia sp. L2A1 TaxID=2686360 RepID=UPI00131BA4C8|nr:hypothetical protein [Cobetia sp. L2A1]
MAFSQEKAAQEGAKVSHDWLRLWSRQHAYTLGRVVSASGARYQAGAVAGSVAKDSTASVSAAAENAGKVPAAAAEHVVESDAGKGGEEGLEVWFKGMQATLLNARGRLECIRDDRRVISPMASEPLLVTQGNEPGWQVSLDDAHNLLTLTASAGLLTLSDDGSSVAPSADTSGKVSVVHSNALVDDSVADAIPDVIAPAATVVTLPYRVEKDGNGGRVFKAVLPKSAGNVKRLQLSVAPGACFDSMQGAPYPLTASLALDGRTLDGCGEAFRY